jgi:hypothetical protein
MSMLTDKVKRTGYAMYMTTNPEKIIRKEAKVKRQRERTKMLTRQ